MSGDNERIPRSEYPKCPRCGGPVAGAMMTSQSVDLGFGSAPRMIYYHPDAVSVYCVSGSCNYQHKLGDLTTPVPERPLFCLVCRACGKQVTKWAFVERELGNFVEACPDCGSTEFGQATP